MEISIKCLKHGKVYTPTKIVYSCPFCGLSLIYREGTLLAHGRTAGSVHHEIVPYVGDPTNERKPLASAMG